MHEPFEILQRDKAIYFLHQINRLPRRVYMNEALPTDVDPHYLGYSVGTGTATLWSSSLPASTTAPCSTTSACHIPRTCT